LGQHKLFIPVTHFLPSPLASLRTALNFFPQSGKQKGLVPAQKHLGSEIDHPFFVTINMLTVISSIFFLLPCMATTFCWAWAGTRTCWLLAGTKIWPGTCWTPVKNIYYSMSSQILASCCNLIRYFFAVSIIINLHWRLSLRSQASEMSRVSSFATHKIKLIKDCNVSLSNYSKILKNVTHSIEVWLRVDYHCKGNRHKENLIIQKKLFLNWINRYLSFFFLLTEKVRQCMLNLILEPS